MAVPADAEDVQTLVEWARAEEIALIPRGAATGMPGGNVGRGVSVDMMAAFGHLHPVDRDAGTIRCGPGAVAGDVARVAAGAGLFLPPLPSSAERCSIGGMVANNAAGARSFRHGATRDWVAALDVVWADGSRSRVEPGRAPTWSPSLAADLGARLGAPPRGWPSVRKNSSGYALDRYLPGGDALHLLVGSEGTLGIVVDVLLRLAPSPQARGVLLVGLDSVDLVPEAATIADRAGASACEMFGRTLMAMTRLEADPVAADVGAGAEATVLFEVEGDADRVEAGMRTLRRWAGSAGTGSAEARDAAGMARLWEIRHAASPLIARAARSGRRSTQFIEDAVVPVRSVPAYVRGVEEILERAGMEAVIFGHAGDGNLHVNPLVPVGTPHWRNRVRTVLEETVDLVAELGGTLSGEHGDGRLRAPFLERIWGTHLTAAFRAVKERIDPAGIFNPGVVIPLPGQDPLEGLAPKDPGHVGTAS